MVVHLVSPDGRYDPVYLRNYALLNVRNELARLPGAGQVAVFGAGDYAMRVWLDPEQGRRARTLGERRRAGDSRAESAGRGGRRRRPADAGSGGVSAHRDGARAGSPTRRSSATSSSRPARTARSRDCATSRALQLGAGDFGLRALLDNKSAVAIVVFQAPGSNALALSSARARARWPSSRRASRRAWSGRRSTTRRSSCAIRFTK